MPIPPLGSACFPTVLVTDDNAETVEILRLYLSRSGMRVLSARSGPQCLALALQQPVDIVLLDIVMPGMSGIETCAALRAQPTTRQLPVLFLTAKDDYATRAAGIRLGVCEFLTKPIRGKRLLNYLIKHTARRPQKQKFDDVPMKVTIDEVQM
ncbi:MAG: response regulator [Deltaproteobacteria bacterium]|nr:response regulator [Deltaproteobacteria bacterium]